MQYMLLIYIPSEGGPFATTEEWGSFTQRLQEAGAMVGGDGLQPASAATTVRVRDDEMLVTDGPFAETKEMLGGYYLIDVDDLDAALGWAAKIPTTHVGSVEVRPVMVYAPAEA